MKTWLLLLLRLFQKRWTGSLEPGAVEHRLEKEEDVEQENAYDSMASCCRGRTDLENPQTHLSRVPDSPALRKEAREAAERAIALDPESSDVLGRAGCAIADLGEEERGCELLERAIENDPSNAQARVALGAAQARLKRFDVGIENMRTAMRISPRDVSLGFWGMMLARALLAAHRTEEALAEAKAASRRDGRLHGARVAQAVALMRLGRQEEARAALAEAQRIHPGLTTTEIAKFFDEEAVSDLKPIWTAAVVAAPGA